MNIFIELNESPPGSIRTAAFAASASFYGEGREYKIQKGNNAQACRGFNGIGKL